MRKSAKIIQINGLKGILTIAFIAICLAAGFIVFPGFVFMNIWNKFLSNYMPSINLFQGILLWAIVVMTYFIASRQSFAISFAQPKELSEDEMRDLMARIRENSQAKFVNNIIKSEEEKVSEDETIKK